MWTLNKPSLRKTIGKDIDELVAHCNMLEDTDKPIIKKLYRDYEQRGGNVTDAQLSIISDDKAKAIQGQYPKTYDGGALNYIRKELIAHAQLCPCCSNSSDFTLDHYMPQSSYKALSVCRLNLIPMCGVCNNLKNGKTYSDFLHAYYDKVPEQEIIKAKVWIVKKRFVVTLTINDSIITDPVICNKIKQQVKELQIMQRLNKAVQQFIANLCISCSCTNSEGLKEWIDEMILHYDSLYGITDWRCAVLRGIKSCEQLDIDVVLHNKNNPRI